MISYRFVPIFSQKGVLFLRHPVVYGCLQDGIKHKSVTLLVYDLEI